MAQSQWRFFIDVGGTFTDVVGIRPDGSVLTSKLLSTGAVRGAVGPGSTTTAVRDERRRGEPPEFWKGYRFAIIGADSGRDSPSRHVRGFHPGRGELILDPALDLPPPLGATYELSSDEPAPVTAIRLLMGLPLSEAIPAVEVRLGTTRATNALLERSGAKVAFITTMGFADVLRIGYQDRPKLFELHVRKRAELAARAIEVDERIAFDGTVLRAPDPAIIRRQLRECRDAGMDSAAICLLHSHVNPAHEELVAGIARDVGFEHVSVSSRVARMEKIVPRGDTTVVDGYLAPVVRAYLLRLGESMPNALLRLMTSAGGLVQADLAAGKDLILSGPAGGVIGCAHVARRAGFDRTIGFDMGGTSTDVSRIDPPPAGFEYQLETVKDGVRIMTPMLAVETVAAGGGSICAFDGIKLTVGPRSAGADPGPLCYGRGGPLTITDMNLFLGRVVAECFPFPLERAAVERSLTRLCDQVNLAGSSTLTPAELAGGFVRIANERMAAAIKRISLARGVDVSGYPLTTFGGAGAQHACAIARLLGIRRVLCSPFAGVLSAVGIGVANVQRIGQRSVREVLDGAVAGRLAPVLECLRSELRTALEREGVPAGCAVVVTSTMDLCYAGQASVITVPAEPWEEARHRFEAAHQCLFGYLHDGRSIEVRAVRVELAAETFPMELRVHPSATRAGIQPGATPLVIDGQSTQVPLHTRADLAPGRRIAGPAVIIEDTSTIVLDPGWDAEVLPTGDLVLTDAKPTQIDRGGGIEADPIRLELYNNQFTAIAEQMGATLRRSALSVNVKERLDFSCAIFTPEGDLVVNAPHIPVHLGGMSDCVRSLIEDVGQFARGDVYITNDPFRGGSHLNDVTVIAPVFDEAGHSIRFFVANRAHHAEIGGTKPGSMPPDSTRLSEEGVLIRAFRWIEYGRVRHDALRALLTAPPYPSRSPDENLADIAAQVAANRTGMAELQKLMADAGWDVVQSYMRHIQQAAERKMRATLRKLPKGRHVFEDQLDDGTPIRLAITIEDGHAVFDFTGTGPVHPGNLNANRPIVTSAVLYCLRCLIDEDIPLNSGVLAPVRMVLPECLLNPPRRERPEDCAAVVGGNVETSQRIVDCILGALQTVAASQGTMNNLLMGNDRFGYYETICGGAGAGPGFDGADAVHTHMTNTRMTDPEVLESRVPVRLVRFGLRQDSGGAGRWRGGCGVIREFEFLEPLDVSILSQRRTTAAYGLSGGQAGRPGRNRLRRLASDDWTNLPPVCHVAVRPGDRLLIETPGGGGWGPAE